MASSRAAWAQQGGVKPSLRCETPVRVRGSSTWGAAEHLEPPHTVTVALLSGTERLATARVMGIQMN